MTAEGRRIDYPCDSNVRWQGTIVCRNFRASSYYPGMGTHCFYSAENRIGEITCLYNSIRVVGADVLGGASWTFPNGSGTEDGRGVLYLDGESEWHPLELRVVAGLQQQQGINSYIDGRSRDGDRERRPRSTTLRGKSELR